MTNGKFMVTRREVNLALLVAAFGALGGVGRGREARLAAPARRVLFDFAIAGGWHHALSIAVDGFVPGERVQVLAEPSNPFDANAVMVLRGDGLMLGYVPRRANVPVSALLREGRTVQAELVEMLDITSDAGVPDDLVFTAFSDGDPRVRLTVEG